MKWIAATALSVISLAACARDAATPAKPTAPANEPVPPAPPPPTPPAPPTPPVAVKPPASALREVFPHIRVDAAAGLVEIDGSVPIDAHNATTPRVYLEVLLCPPDTKEHETIAMTKALPSHVHAALLLTGMEPGTPGVWDWAGEKLNAVPPKGPRVSVTISFAKDGKQVEVPITDCVLDVKTKETLTQVAGSDGFVFAGSQMYKRQGKDTYRADADGTLVGLTTFGGETVAWTRMYNHDSGVEEPHWVANAAVVPAFDTAVVIRIRKEAK